MIDERPPPIWVQGPVAAEAVEAAAAEARHVVRDYAAKYHLADDLRPLLELADRVQDAAVKVGLETLEGQR